MEQRVSLAEGQLNSMDERVGVAGDRRRYSCSEKVESLEQEVARLSMLQETLEGYAATTSGYGTDVQRLAALSSNPRFSALTPQQFESLNVLPHAATPSSCSQQPRDMQDVLVVSRFNKPVEVIESL